MSDSSGPSALLGALVAFVFITAQVVLWGGTSIGVVREHCVDLGSSTAGAPDIDSKWTYILWPPVVFANLDPSGGCVRNSPLREGLSAVGIWELPDPETQVREHVKRQLGAGP